MNVRPKTKRRVAVLLLAMVVILGGASAAVSIRLKHLRARRRAHYEKAILAYEHGEYPQAAHEFDRYLAGSGNTDATALLDDGIAHLRCAGSGSDNNQLLTARVMLSRYLQLQPGEMGAEHELLEVDRQLGYENDVLMLSRRLLAQNPRDEIALAAEVRTLSASGQYAMAERASEQLDALRPHDLVAQAATLELMHLDWAPGGKIVARAQGLLSQSPNDAGYQLLRGLGASWANQPSDARQWLQRAAGNEAQLDTPGVLLLSDGFDHLGQFGQGAAVLQRAASQHPKDDDLRFAWLLREWQTGNVDSVRRELRTVSPTSDARLLALRALVSENPADARAIAAMLQERATDGVAGVWANILRARFVSPPMPPAEAIQRCQIALERDPHSAVAAETLGEIQASVGEHDLAMQAWRDAAELAPAWAQPHVRAAQWLLTEGSLTRAAEQARLAVDRLPDSVPIQALWLRIRGQQLPPNAPRDAVKALLNDVTRIQQQAPFEPQTLPLQVSLLCRCGQQGEAAADARAALDASSALPADAVARLAAVVEANHLPVTDAVRAAATPREGVSAEALGNDAAALASVESATAAYQMLQGYVRVHPDPILRLAPLQFRERHAAELGGAPTAGAWATLSALLPGSAAVQHAVLSSNSAWGDRWLIRQAIDRLRAITGSGGLEWRMAQARWLLMAPGTSTANADAAAALMADIARFAPESPRPLLIWADALQREGDWANALERLKAAAALAPEDAGIRARILALQSKVMPSTRPG